jgi:transcriptional regulator with PAS, ATPase and Fis domain
MYKVGTLAAVVETLRLPDGTVKSIIEGNKRASLGHISFDEDFAKAEAVETEEPPISDPRLVSLISSVLSAFVREHVRAVSVWEKDPESAGLSTAAIILREGQSAIESILKEALRQRRDLARNDRFSEIISNSPAMLEMFKLMEAAAASSISVLIEGETGAGKELVARAIHQTSYRAGGPFMARNCAAIPDGLMESELFGHRRGSFTGALEDKPGLFRAASGGVLFLDEIGYMPLAIQAKLLRAIESGEVTAVGDTRPHKVDVRLLSATSRDLQAAITEGSFRRDLYYRLAAMTIRVPPLRQRREDIPSLAALFLERAAARLRKRIQGIEPEALELLTDAGWPGNVRQLQNEMERAVAMAHDGDTISLRHLSPELISSTVGRAAAAAAPAAS